MSNHRIVTVANITNRTTCRSVLMVLRKSALPGWTRCVLCYWTSEAAWRLRQIRRDQDRRMNFSKCLHWQLRAFMSCCPSYLTVRCAPWWRRSSARRRRRETWRRSAPPSMWRSANRWKCGVAFLFGSCSRCTLVGGRGEVWAGGSWEMWRGGGREVRGGGGEAVQGGGEGGVRGAGGGGVQAGVHLPLCLC